jgi:hypothetical protein
MRLSRGQYVHYDPSRGGEAGHSLSQLLEEWSRGMLEMVVHDDKRTPVLVLPKGVPNSGRFDIDSHRIHSASHSLSQAQRTFLTAKQSWRTLSLMKSSQFST